jgi:hypothetical protein
LTNNVPTISDTVQFSVNYAFTVDGENPDGKAYLKFGTNSSTFQYVKFQLYDGEFVDPIRNYLDMVTGGYLKVQFIKIIASFDNNNNVSHIIFNGYHTV